jgi:uncharacterized protein (DUF1697 family)
MKGTGPGNQGMVAYAAFLRGINVGGRKPMKMEELRKAFASLGFEVVRTVLASGNVLFESPETDRYLLEQRIDEGLKNTFGYKMGVILRTLPEIRDLVDSDPFEGITVTLQTRLYVTFLTDGSKGGLKLPYESPEGDLRILGVSAGVVCSAVTLSAKRGTTDLMRILEKEFGSAVTTRNWNTIIKILNM